MHFVEEGRCCGWTSAWITIWSWCFSLSLMMIFFTCRKIPLSFVTSNHHESLCKCFKDQNCSQRTRPISFLLNFTLYNFHGGKSVGNSRPLTTKSIFDQNVLLSVWKLNWNFTSTLYRFSLHLPLWTFLWTPQKRVFYHRM